MGGFYQKLRAFLGHINNPKLADLCSPKTYRIPLVGPGSTSLLGAVFQHMKSSWLMRCLSHLPLLAANLITIHH